MRAIGISLSQVFGSSQVQNEEKVLFGLAASKGIYEGPARRVSGPAEFGRIAKGDVLVIDGKRIEKVPGTGEGFGGSVWSR